MNKIAQIVVLLILFFIEPNISAQDKSSHEVGFILGVASFTTDYGQRGDFNSNVGGNYGPGIGLIYYFNFTDYRYRWNQRTNYFSEHFRIRAEFSYMFAELDHFGKWVKIPALAKYLEPHHGETSIFNLGAQLEYHFIDIVDYGSRRIPRLWFSPYISAGVFVDFYNPKIYSERGDWQEEGVLLPKWDPVKNPGASSDEPGVTLSATLGIGTRIKAGEYGDIIIENRWQYFFSNYVDGLNAKDDPANKFNDWLVWLHIGYVYYLN